MIVGIDHVIIAVDDLDTAMETWRRIGFQVLRGGEHPQFGTHNALVPLADGFYFELMAIKDPTLIDRFPVTRRLHEVLAGENRFLGFALDSNDLGGDVNAIRERGLTIHKAPPGERVRPDGQVVRWRTAHPEDSRLPFLIEDITARDLRVPLPTEGIGRPITEVHLYVESRNPDSFFLGLTQLLPRSEKNGPFKLKRGQILTSSMGSSYDRIDRICLYVDETILAEQRRRPSPALDEQISCGLCRIGLLSNSDITIFTKLYGSA